MHRAGNADRQRRFRERNAAKRKQLEPTVRSIRSVSGSMLTDLQPGPATTQIATQDVASPAAPSLPNVAESTAPSAEAVVEIAALSRPGGLAWKSARNGSKKGTKPQQRHSRTNWYHPFLWRRIEAAVVRSTFSAHRAVLALKSEDPVIFAHLRKGTVQRWIVAGEKRWTPRTLLNIERRHALSGTGRVGVLTPYPKLTEAISSLTSALRTSALIQCWHVQSCLQ
jgi:hypothetical protein